MEVMYYTVIPGTGPIGPLGQGSNKNSLGGMEVKYQTAAGLLMAIDLHIYNMAMWLLPQLELGSLVEVWWLPQACIHSFFGLEPGFAESYFKPEGVRLQATRGAWGPRCPWGAWGPSCPRGPWGPWGPNGAQGPMGPKMPKRPKGPKGPMKPHIAASRPR